MELAGDFSKFLSSIQPGDSDIADAKAAHEKVRDRLRTNEESKDAHKETFLSGSYARHTAINDINDVDVICVLDLDHTNTEPEVVLTWLQGILNKYYSEVRAQGGSVAPRPQRAYGWTSFRPPWSGQMMDRCGYLTGMPSSGCKPTRRGKSPPV